MPWPTSRRDLQFCFKLKQYLGSHLWAFDGGPWDFLLQCFEGPWAILMSQVFHETLVKHKSILLTVLCIWCPLPLLQLSSGFSSVTSVRVRQCYFSCTLSGMLTHYGSDTNKFIQTQMPFLVVLHVSITVVVGSPAKKMCRPVLVALAAICL